MINSSWTLSGGFIQGEALLQKAAASASPAAWERAIAAVPVEFCPHCKQPQAGDEIGYMDLYGVCMDCEYQTNQLCASVGDRDYS